MRLLWTNILPALKGAVLLAEVGLNADTALAIIMPTLLMLGFIGIFLLDESYGKQGVAREKEATRPLTSPTDHLGRSGEVPQAYWDLGTWPVAGESNPYNVRLNRISGGGRLYVNYWFHASLETKRIYLDYSVVASRGPAELVIGLHDMTRGSDAAVYTVSDITASAYETGSIRFTNLIMYVRGGYPSRADFNLNNRHILADRHKYTVYFEVNPPDAKVSGYVTIRREDFEPFRGYDGGWFH